jgi:hypothetical protein
MGSQRFQGVNVDDQGRSHEFLMEGGCHSWRDTALIAGHMTLPVSLGVCRSWVLLMTSGAGAVRSWVEEDASEAT